jgi:hypothetical protein
VSRELLVLILLARPRRLVKTSNLNLSLAGRCELKTIPWHSLSVDFPSCMHFFWFLAGCVAATSASSSGSDRAPLFADSLREKNIVP